MTETTNDEQSRYAWARRPTAKDDAEVSVPEGYGVPEGHLEPEDDDTTTTPLAAGPYPTAPQPAPYPTPYPTAPQPVAQQPVAQQPVAQQQGAQQQGAQQQGAYAPPPQGWASPRGSYPPPVPGNSPAPGAHTTVAGTGFADPSTERPAGQGGQPGGQPGTPGLSFGYPAPDPVTGQGPAGPPGQLPPVPHQRDPRRPGWGGVVGVGVGAAVLSALLTAGLINATTDDNISPASSTTSQAAAPGPVKTSTVSNPDWSAVARAVEPSVVSVQVQSQTESGEGSGVILNKSGEIVTNNHVVAGVSEGGSVQVILNDGRSYTASVVGTDSQTDLAVIKIKNPPSDLTPATLGTSGDVAVGDPVMAVGNPLGLAGTVTTGIVSATDRPTTTSTSENTNPFGQTSSDDVVITNAIQTDAAVNPGNSGGALVDVQGRVIGVPSSIASLGSSSSSSQSGSIGLGFAIPIDEVKTVAAQLAKGETVKHSYLGVSLSEGTVTVDGAGREAATISDVVAGGPAAKAGLKKGDSVIAVDGEQVNSYTSLVGQLREREPGESVKLTVVRDGKSIDVAVTLGTKPPSGS